MGPEIRGDGAVPCHDSRADGRKGEILGRANLASFAKTILTITGGHSRH
jgi:hypothetical protein